MLWTVTLEPWLGFKYVMESVVNAGVKSMLKVGTISSQKGY